MPSPRMVSSSAVHRSGPTTFQPERSLPLNSETQPSPSSGGFCGVCATREIPPARTMQVRTDFTRGSNLYAQFLPRNTATLVDCFAPHDCGESGHSAYTNVCEWLPLGADAGQEVGDRGIGFPKSGRQHVSWLGL